MATQKQSAPSFTTILSVLSIVFYCAGFLRVEPQVAQAHYESREQHYPT